jgi:hypothetical protein
MYIIYVFYGYYFIMPRAKYILMSCHILIYKYIVSKYINYINVVSK